MLLLKIIRALTSLNDCKSNSEYFIVKSAIFFDSSVCLIILECHTIIKLETNTCTQFNT